jgi:hypothetical protein
MQAAGSVNMRYINDTNRLMVTFMYAASVACD